MPTLTPREQEVLGLLGDGLACKEIAYRLNISRKTIDTHVYHIKCKIDIASIHDLVVYAVQKKLQYRDNLYIQPIDWVI